MYINAKKNETPILMAEFKFQEWDILNKL